MHICALTQTQPRQHPTTQFFTGFLPPKQQRQSTEAKAQSNWKSTVPLTFMVSIKVIYAIGVVYIVLQ